MSQHWTLDDIPWDRFDRAKVDPELLMAVKGASLVEGNAADYVGYLSQIFADEAATIALFEDWGREEIQHGEALGRWATLADPQFDFHAASAAFKAGYHPPHFDSGEAVRGSRRGEMIARCVVETGTSSFYSAMKDAAEEPVLKAIATRIAADEYRHYRLFYETLQHQTERALPLWRRILVAAQRVTEAEDDELGYAFYCGNTPVAEIGRRPYDRKASIRAYQRPVVGMYRQHHVKKAAQMIAKAIDANPKGWLAKGAAWFVWRDMRARVRAAA
jgi:rubrerythrin